MTRELIHRSSGHVATWRQGHAAGIVVDRPAAINALTLAMVNDITGALDEYAVDDAVQTVVISGQGRGLCAGGDMKAIRQLVVDRDRGAAEFFAREYEMNARIASYPKPLVALMDGLVMGGGIGLSAHASHRVVTERSVLAMPEVAIGFVPDVGSTWLLAHAPGHLGTYLGLTGSRMDAADAIHAGLADLSVHTDDLDGLVEALATEVVGDAMVPFVAEPDTAPPAALAANHPWIDDAFGADTVMGILERLDDQDPGLAPQAATVAQELRDASPTALVATFDALRYGRTAEDLADCLDNEFRVGTAIIESHDFLEGTRAVLVDKDRTPSWNPAPLTAEVEDRVRSWVGAVESTTEGPRIQWLP